MVCQWKYMQISRHEITNNNAHNTFRYYCMYSISNTADNKRTLRVDCHPSNSVVTPVKKKKKKSYRSQHPGRTEMGVSVTITVQPALRLSLE